MMRCAMTFAVLGLLASCALAEYITPPPWDQSLPFPQTYQGWQMPPQLTGIPDGTVLDTPLPPAGQRKPVHAGAVHRMALWHLRGGGG
jgi:hypothetical protein